MWKFLSRHFLRFSNLTEQENVLSNDFFANGFDLKKITILAFWEKGTF